MDFILDGIITAFRLLAAGDAETFSAVGTSLLVTLQAMVATLVLGIPAGFCLGHLAFPGRRTLRLLVETCLSLPTVVIGLVVFAFLSRRGPLGELELLFTVAGMAVGLTILALPIVVAMTATAVEGLDQGLKDTLRNLGADGWQLAAACLWEARFPVVLAAVTAFGRVISEIGIAMMIGGNIKWQTRTITTAIALETGKGQFAQGIALGIVLMAIALAANLATSWLKGRAPDPARRKAF